MREFSRLKASEFRMELETGSTRPCVFACEDSDGHAAGEFVVKLRSAVRSGPAGLAFEFLAAHLAEHLGIPIPEAALVEIEPELADTLPHTLAVTAARIKDSAGLNFGTRYMTPGYVTWPVDERLPEALRQRALEVVAFDALIDNADRNRNKPNVLWKGDELFVIDHEVTFAFLLLVGGSAARPRIERVAFLRQHPFYQGLRVLDDLNLTRFVQALATLTNDQIDAMLEAVPPEFGADGHFERISGHLRGARDEGKAFGAAILGVLR